MTIELLGALVGVAAGICGIIFGVTTYSRNHSTDVRQEAKENGQILTEIGYVKSGVDDIKRKQEKQDSIQLEFAQKLYSVESSANSAHKRIDNIEEHLDVRCKRD